MQENHSLVRNIWMAVGISLATNALFSVMSKKADHRVTGLIPHRPDIFQADKHVVFIGSASICLASTLVNWTAFK